MRIAVIDCGTNTFNILIVDVENGSCKQVFNTRSAVKLGESAINQGFIAEIPFLRGIDALIEFKAIIDEFIVDKVLAFATSAIRDAVNGKDFVKMVKERAGLDLKVIDGNEEAMLIYAGCREAVPLLNGISLIMDIGGGSTEFILADRERIYWKKSFNLGASRLLQRFNPSDPILNKEVKDLFAYLDEESADLKKAIAEFPPVELIGTSGAFDSIIEMIHGEFGGEEFTDSKTCYEVDNGLLNKISEKVKHSTLSERREIKGLVPMRFDMIVISCLLIEYVLKLAGLRKLRVSTYSLKEGALAVYLKEINS